MELISLHQSNLLTIWMYFRMVAVPTMKGTHWTIFLSYGFIKDMQNCYYPIRKNRFFSSEYRIFRTLQNTF